MEAHKINKEISELTGISGADFVNDLNAMHAAECYAIAHIPEFDSRYWIKLAEVTKCTRLDGKQIGHATAAQRAEAFMDTLKQMGGLENGK